MSLIAELQRRNVFKVGVAYLALAWVVVQISGTVVPAFGMPDWTLKFVIWLGVIGFPFVVVFSWVFELTPEGLKRESEIDRSQSITHLTSRKLDYLIIALLVLAIAVTALDRLLPASAPADAAGTASSVGAGHARDIRADAAAPPDPVQGPLPPRQMPDDRSIAVLPFVNMSSDQEQEYFADGISEELLNLLAKIPELKVIARTSSFAFKGRQSDIADIAAKLRVAHVLEGSVRKAGSKVRITAQLIRTADSVHLWSETYDRSLEDIFAVQDEIARSVVEQLKIKLLGGAPAIAAGNAEAYALTLQARAMASQLTPEGNTRALALYQQALALEPGNARALEGLSRVYANLSNMSSTDEREVIERQRLAREAANGAVAADPEYSLGHLRLGLLAMGTDNDLDAAARHVTRALQLAPADPDTLSGASTLLRELGRLDEAIAIGEYIAARDPVSVDGHRWLCMSQVLAGRWDAAIASCNTALALSPGTSQVQYQIGLALLGKGDAAAALAAFENEAGDEEYRTKGRAVALYTLGRQAEFEQTFTALRQRWGAMWPSEIAQVYAWVGDTDQTFAWLDKAVAQNESGLTQQFLQPLYQPVRADPRWAAFCERVGMSEAQLAAIPFEVKLPN